MIFFHSRIALFHGFFGGFFRDFILSERPDKRIYQGFGARHIDIRIDEIVVAQLGNVCAKQLGVIRHDRAIIVVVAVTLVNIVAFARVENEVHAFFEQVEHMSVDELCRVANGVGRYRVLTVDKRLARGLVGNHRAEAELVKYRVEERQLLVEIKAKRYPHRSFRVFDGVFNSAKQGFIFVCEQIG